MRQYLNKIPKRENLRLQHKIRQHHHLNNININNSSNNINNMIMKMKLQLQHVPYNFNHVQNMLRQRSNLTPHLHHPNTRHLEMQLILFTLTHDKFQQNHNISRSTIVDLHNSLPNSKLLLLLQHPLPFHVLMNLHFSHPPPLLLIHAVIFTNQK